jgi:hypothetical protein
MTVTTCRRAVLFVKSILSELQRISEAQDDQTPEYWLSAPSYLAKEN